MAKPNNKGTSNVAAATDTLPIKDETLTRLLDQVREAQEGGERSKLRAEATTATKVLKVCAYVWNLPPNDRKKIEEKFTQKKGRPTTPELEQYAPVLKMALPDSSATLRTRFAKALYQLEHFEGLSVRDTPESDIINTVEKSGGINGLANSFDEDADKRQVSASVKPPAEMNDQEFGSFAEPVFLEAKRRGLLYFRRSERDAVAQPVDLVIMEKDDGTKCVEFRPLDRSVSQSGRQDPKEASPGENLSSSTEVVNQNVESSPALGEKTASPASSR